MVALSEGLEMFWFSVMESSFCFANVKFVIVTATRFIHVDDFGPLRSVQAIFSILFILDQLKKVKSRSN